MKKLKRNVAPHTPKNQINKKINKNIKINKIQNNNNINEQRYWNWKYTKKRNDNVSSKQQLLYGISDIYTLLFFF